MSYVHTVAEKVCYINYVYSIYSLFTFDVGEGANRILIEFILDKQGYVLNQCVFTKKRFLYSLIQPAYAIRISAVSKET